MYPVYFALSSGELLVTRPKKAFADFIDLIKDFLVWFESCEEVNRLAERTDLVRVTRPACVSFFLCQAESLFAALSMKG